MTDFPTSGKGFLPESDSQSITNPLDVNRRLIVDITFAEPVTIQQADMLEAFDNLTSQQCTELVTDWYLFWVTFHTQYRMVD